MQQPLTICDKYSFSFTLMFTCLQVYPFGCCKNHGIRVMAMLQIMPFMRHVPACQLPFVKVMALNSNLMWMSTYYTVEQSHFVKDHETFESIDWVWNNIVIEQCDHLRCHSFIKQIIYFIICLILHVKYDWWMSFRVIFWWMSFHVFKKNYA